MAVWGAILFQTLCHIKCLLAINRYSCRSIWLNVGNKPSAVRRLTALVVHPNSTYLGWVMQLIYWDSSRFSVIFIGFYETNIEIILDVITRDRVSRGSDSLNILLKLLCLSSNRISPFSVYSLYLLYLFWRLWSTEVNFSISWLRRPLWTSSVEKATTNHGSLIHNQLWRKISNNSI